MTATRFNWRDVLPSRCPAVRALLTHTCFGASRHADYNDPSEGCTICPDSNVSALMPLIIAGGALLIISVLSSCCHLISRRLAKRKKSLPSLVRLFELQGRRRTR